MTEQERTPLTAEERAELRERLAKARSGLHEVMRDEDVSPPVMKAMWFAQMELSAAGKALDALAAAEGRVTALRTALGEILRWANEANAYIIHSHMGANDANLHNYSDRLRAQELVGHIRTAALAATAPQGAP